MCLNSCRWQAMYERVYPGPGDDPGGTRSHSREATPEQGIKNNSQDIMVEQRATKMSKSAALERQCGRLSATGTAQAHLS